MIHPGVLYQQAVNERGAEGPDAVSERYRELLREHKLILLPGDEGYEQESRTLPCGWRPRQERRQGD